MKRTISIPLAVLMLAMPTLFGGLGTTEAAFSETCGDNLTWPSMMKAHAPSPARG